MIDRKLLIHTMNLAVVIYIYEVIKRLRYIVAVGGHELGSDFKLMYLQSMIFD